MCVFVFSLSVHVRLFCVPNKDHVPSAGIFTHVPIYHMIVSILMCVQILAGSQHCLSCGRNTKKPADLRYLTLQPDAGLHCVATDTG